MVSSQVVNKYKFQCLRTLTTIVPVAFGKSQHRELGLYKNQENIGFLNDFSTWYLYHGDLVFFSRKFSPNLKFLAFFPRHQNFLMANFYCPSFAKSSIFPRLLWCKIKVGEGFSPTHHSDSSDKSVKFVYNFCRLSVAFRCSLFCFLPTGNNPVRFSRLCWGALAQPPPS